MQATRLILHFMDIPIVPTARNLNKYYLQSIYNRPTLIIFKCKTKKKLLKTEFGTNQLKTRRN